MFDHPVPDRRPQGMPKVQISPSLDGIEKLRELTLYVSRKSEADEPFSSTKLNKLLFYIDFSAYWDFGKPITGEEYQCLEFGPAPRRILPLLKAMDPDQLVLVERNFHGLS
jgi:antitoxin SocA-like protein